MPYALKVEKRAPTITVDTDDHDWLKTPLREIWGDLVLSDKKLYAWYRLGSIRTNMLSDNEWAALLAELKDGWTGLAGRDFMLRGTHRPYSPAEWSHAFSKRAWAWTNTEFAQARTVPDNPAEMDRYVTLVQQTMRTRRQSHPEWYLRVEIGPRKLLDAVVKARVNGRSYRRAKDTLQRRVAEVSAVVLMAPAFRGRRATHNEVVWLQHKSRGLLLPEPVEYGQASIGGGMSSHDVATFDDTVHVDPRPLADTLKVTARGGRNGPARQRIVAELRAGNRILLDLGQCPIPVRVSPVDVEPDPDGAVRVAWEADDGRIGIHTFGYRSEVTLAPAERYVAILRMSRMESQTVPGPFGPWLGALNRAPHEVVIHGRASAGEEARKRVVRRLKVMADQLSQQETLARESGYISDELDEVTEAARRMAGRMSSAATNPNDKVEFDWTCNIAVAGVTHKDATDRADAVKQMYRLPQIVLEQPAGKEALYQEFDIASERRLSAYQRFAFGDFWVSGIPNAASQLGDGEGVYLGETIDGSNRVCWDPFKALYVGEASGFIPINAGLGQGKSNLIGILAHGVCISGISATILDPSGPLGRLAYHPGLADNAAHLNLLHAPAGTLSPFSAVPDPLRDNYKTTDKYKRAVKDAAMQRRDLAIDLMLRMLHKKTRADPRTTRILEAVLDKFRCVATDRLETALNHLQGIAGPGGTENDWAAVVHRELTARANGRYGDLFFKQGHANALTNARLLVITMAGMQIPRIDTPEEDYTRDQQWAVLMLLIASFLTASRAYSRRMGTPHLIGLDEQHWLSLFASGRQLLQRLVRDSRKWRLVVLAGSQHPMDVLKEDIGNFVGGAFIGRMEDPEAQRRGLELLRTKATPEHMAFVGNLSAPLANGHRANYREFIWRDPTNQVDTFRVQFADPILKACLNPQDATFNQYLPEDWDIAA